jgi:hypothetical protein
MLLGNMFPDCMEINSIVNKDYGYFIKKASILNEGTEKVLLEYIDK